MLKKRGLSAVITTLIIILLVLVSVGILWVVVRNLVQEGAEQIDLGAFTLDLQIKNVEVTGDNVTVTVFVKRNPGQGNFVGMNFVFSDGKDSEIMREDTVLEELEERSFTFALSKIKTNELVTVSVAPIYELSSGRESTGDISDTFDAKAGKSIATGGVVAPPEGNFALYGPVGAGTTEYSVSSGGGELPEFKKAIIDPLDVKLGDNQTFTVEVYSPNGIASVTTRTQLDTELLILPLQKIAEDAEKETYSATWQVYDTHTNIYRTTFVATDNAGNENNITLTWTDPCSGLTHGSNSILSTGCTVSTIDGLDTGNITIATGVTLTLNSGSTFAWTPGNSIIVDGTIALGGSLKKGYLYYTDADADSYGASGTYTFNTAPSLSGGVRAKDALGTSDCNDNNVSEWQNINGYTDSDSDGYSPSGAIPVCSGSTLSSSYISTSGFSSATVGPTGSTFSSGIFRAGCLAWTNPGNLAASDNLYASITLNPSQCSIWVYGTSFSFNIPLDSRIDGIKVEIERRYAGTGIIEDGLEGVKLFQYSVGYTASKLAGDWSTTEGYVTYGGPTDTWGVSWIPEQINNFNFRVTQQARNRHATNLATAYVDHIRVTVYYTTQFLRSTTLDCYDGDSNVRPEKLSLFDSYFSTAHGGGGFDYNCDSVETKQDVNLTTEFCDGGCIEDGDSGWGSVVPACGQSPTDWEILSCDPVFDEYEDLIECNEFINVITRTQSCR